ncbi:MAG: tetratricopeptide repeat protein [Terriglobia bacterium]
MVEFMSRAGGSIGAARTGIEGTAIPENSTQVTLKGLRSQPSAPLGEAVSRNPNDGILATQHADALQEEGQLVKAAAEYRRALSLDATLGGAWYGLGRVELDLGGKGEAKRCFERALALAPHRAPAHFNLGKALFDLGEIDAALDHFRIAADGPEPGLRERALGALACIIPGSPRADHAAVLQTRRAWAEVEAAREAPAIHSIQRPEGSGGKLRLGYCSRFFPARNWMKPVWGVINHHDRSVFEIHLFSDGLPPSAESGYQAHPLDQVHDARGLSNADLASLITRTGIDILVDLNGYSHPPRLGLFMRRPAPVIVGWFNMYATSGIDGFDYIIGDAAVIPAVEEQFYCECVSRVPGTYLAFSVPYSVPDVVPPPCLAGGPITFASLCSQYKITDEVIAAWAMILRQVPDAQLLLKNAALGDRTNCAALHERFGRWEIPPTRVLLEGPAPHDEFLAAYGRADISLDTFPYNGGTTTMEALWQGVPVLTFNGDRWASRQSRSLLLAAGLDEWCMPDCDAYVARAVSLARSPDTPARLASLRATLRERLAHMPVCDSAGLCRALERIYRQVSKWRLQV